MIISTDTQLVARQSTGEFSTKVPQLMQYVATLDKIKLQFNKVKIEQISRSQNNSEDALARLASAFDGGQREILVDSVSVPSCNLVTSQAKYWRLPVLEYLQGQKMLEDKNEGRKLQTCIPRFCQLGDVL